MRRPDGTVDATVPGETGTPTSIAGRAYLPFTAFSGEACKVERSSRVSAPVRTGDTLLLPASAEWLPLGDDRPVALASHPSEWREGVKTAAARPGAEVEVSMYDGRFWLRGLPKLAAEGQGVDVQDALFLLAAAGCPPERVIAKIASRELTPYRSVHLGVRGDLVPMGDATAGAVKTAADLLGSLPFPAPVDLTKEAAMLPDPTTVDAVLSLQFLSPENIRQFLDAQAYLDEAQKRVCKLLLGCRLGLKKELPPQALEQTMRGLETIIGSLRQIDYQMKMTQG